MIDTVIFDWGGVLIDDPAPLLLREFSHVLGAAYAAVAAAVGKHADPFQKGLCSEQNFWVNCCADLAIDPPAAASLWGDAFRRVYSPKPQVWSLARSLKSAGLRTALLSNTEHPAIQCFYERRDNPFDQLIFSCCEACRKPERRIYELAIERLGSHPEITVFIDDNEAYVHGARAIGIHGIRFRDYPTLIRDLGALGLPLQHPLATDSEG